VTLFSPNDISGLRRPKNFKFATKVASSTRMMHTLRFLAQVFYLWENLQKTSLKGTNIQKMTNCFYTHYCRNHILIHKCGNWQKHSPWCEECARTFCFLINYALKEIISVELSKKYKEMINDGQAPDECACRPTTERQRGQEGLALYADELAQAYHCRYT